MFNFGTDLHGLFLACGYWLKDLFISSDFCYLSIPLSNCKHPIPNGLNMAMSPQGDGSWLIDHLPLLSVI